MAGQIPGLRGTSSPWHLHEVPLPHKLPAWRDDLGAVTNQTALYVKHSETILVFPELEIREHYTGEFQNHINSRSYLFVDVPSQSVDLFKCLLETLLVRMAIGGVLDYVLQ